MNPALPTMTVVAPAFGLPTAITVELDAGFAQVFLRNRQCFAGFCGNRWKRKSKLRTRDKPEGSRLAGDDLVNQPAHGVHRNAEMLEPGQDQLFER